MGVEVWWHKYLVMIKLCIICCVCYQSTPASTLSMMLSAAPTAGSVHVQQASNTAASPVSSVSYLLGVGSKCKQGINQTYIYPLIHPSTGSIQPHPLNLLMVHNLWLKDSETPIHRIQSDRSIIFCIPNYKRCIVSRQGQMWNSLCMSSRSVTRLLDSTASIMSLRVDKAVALGRVRGRQGHILAAWSP